MTTSLLVSCRLWLTGCNEVPQLSFLGLGSSPPEAVQCGTGKPDSAHNLKITTPFNSLLFIENCRQNCLHFGRIWVSESEPNWHEVAPNIASQNEQQNDPLSDSFEVDFGMILASNLGPKSERVLDYAQLFLVSFGPVDL